VTRAVLVTLTIVVICGLIGWALGIALIAKPVDRMIALAKRIGSGDFSGHLDVKGTDELSQLGRALNAMSDQLSREIDERRRAEEHLRHAERLTTVGRLASGVAHELGTPLNVVHARAKIIETRNLDREKLVDNARVIVEQSERMTSIIRQLLDFARRDGTHERKPVDLATLARETCEMLQPIAQKHKVELKTNGAAADVVTGDRTQLQQVLSNLLLNAIQSMPEGGEVTVATCTKEQYAGLAVRDQGVGIPAEQIPRVFEPFFTTKDVGEGTGLGLSVAHGIVEEHGGFIEVESTIGRGSSFTMYLPKEGPC
jgi:signal transduction histidine kinase